jgi:hypothetical protein
MPAETIARNTDDIRSERMNRFGAFAVHLGISLIIFLILGYVILFHWYPDFFFASDGGWQGIRIVAFVDLVLGPTLTLVVFNPSKPRQELKRDLSIIGAIQIICLTAGVWVVYSERPIAMVFSDGGFYSMTRDDYHQAGEQTPDLGGIEGPSPRWVSVRLPEDPGAQSRIRNEAMAARTPLRAIGDLYVPFSTSHIDPTRDGLPVDQLNRRDRQTPFLASFLEENGGQIEDYVFLPFGTRYALALIAFRKSDDALLYLAVPGGLTPST